MLHGPSLYTVDDRHRAVLPRHLASELSEDIIATLGPEKNILLYKYDSWYDWCKKIGSRPMDETTLIWDRLFVAMAQKIEIDKQQRFVIPEGLRQYTGIEKGTDVIFLGARNRVEIWRRDAWFSYLEAIPRERIYQVMSEVERITPADGGDLA